jgi:hypothetical protein
MSGTTLGLVLDCADPAKLADFWAPALRYTNIGEAGNYVLLLPSDPGRPKLLLQSVPEAKLAKNRVHFDLETPDIEGEAVRLEGLGARRLETGVREEHGNRWLVMADPEGNEFCVCDGGSGPEQAPTP